ncbi:hypothetical protein [Staphylococcus epidermidis]|uniref:hypothetical protein n=1 Tax=Staphylococcus epidermidis TaxID=1282 RepID=UPI0034DB35F8
MSDLQSFIKIVWFIICGILIIILGSNDKLIGVFLIVFLGIIGFRMIEYFCNKKEVVHSLAKVCVRQLFKN